mgnify:FL=1
MFIKKLFEGLKSSAMPEKEKAVVAGFHRQALHAYLLQFEHPRSGEIMRFESPLPEDMIALIAALKGDL